jgi:hypothetical protein
MINNYMSISEKLQKRLDQVKSSLQEGRNAIYSAVELVPNEIAEERMSICNSCEHLFAITSQCKKCACFVKVKTKLAAVACPIKKWTIFERNVDVENGIQ